MTVVTTAAWRYPIKPKARMRTVRGERKGKLPGQEIQRPYVRGPTKTHFVSLLLTRTSGRLHPRGTATAATTGHRHVAEEWQRGRERRSVSVGRSKVPHVRPHSRSIWPIIKSHVRAVWSHVRSHAWTIRSHVGATLSHAWTTIRSHVHSRRSLIRPGRSLRATRSHSRRRTLITIVAVSRGRVVVRRSRRRSRHRVVRRGVCAGGLVGVVAWRIWSRAEATAASTGGASSGSSY